MTTASLVNVRPLYLQVRDNLVERIGDGKWAIGAIMPNEIALAREFGISAGTVRKALDLMETEQLIERKQGRGTFVSARKPAKVCPHCKQPIRNGHAT